MFVVNGELLRNEMMGYRNRLTLGKRQKADVVVSDEKELIICTYGLNVEISYLHKYSICFKLILYFNIFFCKASN